MMWKAGLLGGGEVREGMMDRNSRKDPGLQCHIGAAAGVSNL